MILYQSCAYHIKKIFFSHLIEKFIEHVTNKLLSGTSLWAQWLRLCLQCRGCRFDPRTGSEGPTFRMAKKIEHETETVL